MKIKSLRLPRLPSIRKRNLKADSTGLDKQGFHDIPNEIFVLESAEDTNSLKCQQKKPQHNSMTSSLYMDDDSEPITTKLILDLVDTDKSSMSTASSSSETESISSSSGASSEMMGSRFSSMSSSETSTTSGIMDDLWKSVTDTNGPITKVDDLCFHQIIRMMSLNDAARKNILDGILNRGEF